MRLLNSIVAVLAIAAGLVFIPAQSCMAVRVTRIRVVPFTVNASENMDFLGRGVTQMLITRLGGENQVIVKALPLGEQTAVQVLEAKQADYVIMGSLTVLTGRVSTDAQVLTHEAGVEKTVLFFGRTGHQQSDIVDHIDALALEIKAQLLGQKIPAQVQPPDAVPASPAPSADTNGTRVAQTQPPVSRQTKADLLEPLLIPGLEAINEQLNGLAAGDLDGDGRPELVVITQNRLMVYHRVSRAWAEFAQFKGKGGSFIGIDTADLNGNGRQEVFVTNFDDTEGRVASFVMEWDGSKLQRLAGLLPWYFRAVDIENRGRTLVGQRQGPGEPFMPGIYAMAWHSEGYKPGKRLSLPKDLNVFGFAHGIVRSAGTMETVTYRSSGHVQVLDTSGSEMVVSAERFGGGTNKIIFTDEEQWDEADHLFLPPRILLHDLDSDGIQEILVVNNQTSFGARGVFEHHRRYTKGRLQWLKIFSGGLRATIGTLDMPRFIADATLVDIDGDGRLEMIAAVVSKPRGSFSKGASSLVAFEITPVK
jgi:TolB-like protein